MARKSVRNRNLKRVKLANRLRDSRAKLRVARGDIHLPEEERWEAGQDYQKMPRDSSRSRQRNTCKLCGRPRGYNRLTGLCRLHMRIAIINGMVPGMRKASW